MSQKISNFNESEMVQDKFDYCYSMIENTKSFNITFGIDKNFLYGCGIAISSILINNKDVDFHFHVFTDFITEEDKNKFQKLSAENNTNISVYIINCEQLKTLPNSKNWTYATYFRFLIAEYFYGKVDRILYLDADIACKGDITFLRDITLLNNEIAAVVEENGADWWRNRAQTLSIPDLEKRYFNAGVLVINIPVWERFEISKNALSMLADPEVAAKITHLDQDILNILLVNHVKYIDVAYNTRFSLNYMLKDNPSIPIKDNTVIVHYIGPTKPWHKWASYPCSSYFLSAKNASPWRDDDLLGPANVGQWRYAAKHYIKMGKWLSGFKAYILYFFKKSLINNG